jgi:NAD(P)-dependent dehydrogenase (short-subunit alcohol dehydrogenase family)
MTTKHRSATNDKEYHQASMMMKVKEEKNPVARLRSFEGAVVIITGGASGICKASAEEVVEKGAHALVLADRQVDLAKEVATKLRSKKGTLETKVYEIDVRDFDAMQKVVTETKEAYSRLDYMFNNAGIIIAGSIDQIGVDDLNYVLDVNIRGVTNGVQAAYPLMKEQGFGHIVNTSSMASLIPNGEGFSAYGTSKYAVIGLSLNLRVEAARHGVYVSALCPGVIDTPILKECGGKYGKSKSGLSQEAIDNFLDKIYASRFHPMAPTKFAAKTLKLVGKNKPIIIVPGWPWEMVYFWYRIFPSLDLYLAIKINNMIVKKMEEELFKNSGE